ncbi:quinol monooxygenase YgiN [Arcticibacter tournemirensis]|uniref:Antibiotic biosynthesis monooxygenase n=1 Tax=Arcticibacter tournemirensis TaxID=699437 RepID=A0A4Q0MC84_9SPHI|nr:antibiotic biosynthesis monooxygenase family protein [Arcticibacter tournemirensis]KAA8485027.1 antibiotic biosynthesis monooxygenase [Arcticibacter tournemirensis]RXF70396.1 antibiotic biosynthesis monooxygenase [Arcticibacter tournemirensis]TQM50518.1 quinol monooxygenase YgiN [Arcticibacter tournemirensis]
MITRVVKMAFQPEKSEEFLHIFYETQRVIIHQFEGCVKLDLLRDSKNPDLYFTLSYWRSEEDLETYRSSEYFKTTWPSLRKLFSERAQAWTLTPQ